LGDGQGEEGMEKDLRGNMKRATWSPGEGSTPSKRPWKAIKGRIPRSRGREERNGRGAWRLARRHRGKRRRIAKKYLAKYEHFKKSRGFNKGVSPRGEGEEKKIVGE